MNKLILEGTVYHTKDYAKQLYTGILVQVVHSVTGYTIYLWSVGGWFESTTCHVRSEGGGGSK